MLEIIRTTDQGLNDQVWSFGIWSQHGGNPEITIALNSYTRRSRSTTRHKMKAWAVWNRIDQRDNTIKTTDVLTPDDVLLEVQSMIKFRFELPSGTVTA